MKTVGVIVCVLAFFWMQVAAGRNVLQVMNIDTNVSPAPTPPAPSEPPAPAAPLISEEVFAAAPPIVTTCGRPVNYSSCEPGFTLDGSQCLHDCPAGTTANGPVCNTPDPSFNCGDLTNAGDHCERTQGQPSCPPGYSVQQYPLLCLQDCQDPVTIVCSAMLCARSVAGCYLLAYVVVDSCTFNN